MFEKKLRKITHEFQYIWLASQLLPRYVHEPFAKSEQLYEVVGPKIFYFINKITSFLDKNSPIKSLCGLCLMKY